MSRSAVISWYRLILHPADGGEELPDRDALLSTLHSLGFIGASFRHDDADYFIPGERFLELIVFLGCSPAIETHRQNREDGAPEMNAFCHVHLPAPLVAPALLLGDRDATPRCPGCRTPIADWRDWFARWQAQPTQVQWQCPVCAQKASAAAINWRQAAGVTRSRIEVGGIFPYEAVPSDELLTALQRATGLVWKYFYARP